MNDPSQMLNRTYGMWPPAATPVGSVTDPIGFQNPRFVFDPTGSKAGRMNWKNKKAADKRKKAIAAASNVVPSDTVSTYKPPTLNELQYQNRVKARRFYPKKKFARFAPFAPRNTTSFIIRAKKSGGIASLVSPCPVTPAILPTPKFSPSREGLVDMAKEEWGVDGYGSMKGLIRLRSPTSFAGHSAIGCPEEGDDLEEGSSESDVEEHVEVERRLDHDLSRFEIFYPTLGEDQGGANSAAYLLENRVDDQDTHIAHLEEENLTLKERLFLMEREMEELRRRLQLLETDYTARNENRNYINDDNNNNNDDDDDDVDDGEEINFNMKEEASENEGRGVECSDKSVEDCEDSIGNLMQH